MKKKILFVCPTNRWEARERSLVHDIKIALTRGSEVSFYGLKNSPLDKHLYNEKITKFYHPGLVQTHFFLWPKLKVLSTLLEDEDLALVHCYKLNILWPICFFLRGNKEVSVIHSQYFELKKNYRVLWHRLLIRRCDMIFVPFEHLVKNAWSRLGMPSRKIEVRPPLLTEVDNSREEAVIFDKFEQFYSIGLYVSDSDKSLNKFSSYIKALEVSNEYFNWKKPIKLVFVTEGLWSEKTVYQGLKQRVLDAGVEEHVVFYSGGKPSNYIQHFDLWMSLLKGEGLDDFALMAISIGTPILVPRHPSTVEFFSVYGRVGETYKNNDVREIVRKWERLLSDPDAYQDQIEAASGKIRKEHSYINQENQYLRAYEKVVLRRERYRLRKAESASLKP